MKKIITLTIIVALFAFKASAQNVIATKDAAKHIGETVTIYDKVFSAKLISPSNMTFLDLGGYHPNELITVVIKGADRSKFKGAPEDYYKGRNVSVTGTAIDYKGKPEIVVTDPKQIKLNMSDNPAAKAVKQ